MTLELQWRRRFKSNLETSPWKPLDLDTSHDKDATTTSRKFLVKTKFDDSSYEFLITDLKKFWFEEMHEDQLKRKVKNLNPSIEAPVSKILDQIKSSLEKPSKETQLSVIFKADQLVLDLNAQLAGIPMHYTFQAKEAPEEMGRNHLTIPLMAMVGELYRQQEEMFKLLAAKDKEIDDYKSQGSKVSRKYLQTTPFDEVAFRNSMITSKGFEEEVKAYGEKAFTSRGQDLYREINTKRAWLHSSPAKDNGEPTASVTTTSVESWASRLPGSMAHKATSPSKSDSPVKSPAKSPASSKGSSTESTPTKDTEMMRRQALERKLELEEAKQQEKVKKKKKLKF